MNEPRKIALVIAILMVIGLIAYAFERLAETVGKWWLVLAGVSFAALLLLLGAHFAHAHDASRPELNDWFNRLASGKGLCCSMADGFAISDIDWETKDGHYRVFISAAWLYEHYGDYGKTRSSGDGWYDVPDAAVITEPNRAGRTMVWPSPGPTGVGIRCFMPGSMT